MIEAGLTDDTPRNDEMLMLAYWYPPVNESGALRPYRFCKYLKKSGWSPSVVAAPASDRTSEEAVYRVPTAESKDNTAYRWARVIRGLERVLPYHDGLDWVPHAVAAANQVISRQKISVMVSTSPPLATHVAGLLLKRRHGTAWIADFRDPLLGNPFRARIHGRLYDAVLERCIVSQADAVIVNTDAAQKSLIKRYPAYRDKVRLIWNGYDPDDEIKAASIPSRPYRVIAHFGSLYGGRHPGIVLNSLQRLFQHGNADPEKIRISLIGYTDPDAAWARSPAYRALEGHRCIECTNQVLPRDEARRLMAEADYLLLLDMNERMTGLQVPAKIFEYVRIGRPILTITARNSPTERILHQSGVPHVCIYPDDPEDEVDRKVLALLALPCTPVAPSRSFSEQYDAKNQTQSLVTVMASVAKRD